MEKENKELQVDVDKAEEIIKQRGSFKISSKYVIVFL
jgi:hypothetical protein